MLPAFQVDEHSDDRGSRMEGFDTIPAIRCGKNLYIDVFDIGASSRKAAITSFARSVCAILSHNSAICPDAINMLSQIRYSLLWMLEKRYPCSGILLQASLFLPIMRLMRLKCSILRSRNEQKLSISSEFRMRFSIIWPSCCIVCHFDENILSYYGDG